MRVSHRNRFNYFVGNMNSSLSDLMELNIQAASQKRINKPSDDSIGAARVLNHRDAIGAYDQYRNNVDTAKGWLNIADNTIMEVNTVLTRLRELGEQAATGTVSGENREQVSYEARQLFEQLINMANTEHEGKHIFSGHKTGESAFVETLWMTTSDTNLQNIDFSITGEAQRSIVVQFLESGTVGGATDMDYRYSTDGGDNWTTATLTAGDDTLNLDGVLLNLENGATITAVDVDNNASVNNGSWLWVRPTAQYMGDDVDSINVSSLSRSTLNTTATGNFNNNVVVRIDSATSLASGISYSYSADGGISWNTGNTVTSGVASNATLVVQGGYLALSSNAGNTLSAGDQWVIQPRTGRIMVEISPNESLQINSIGKDVFGGVYTQPGASNASVVYGDNRNMFEAVGKLVCYLETNNQSGIQEALEGLSTADQHMLTSAASIGARENRLDVMDNVLETLQLNEEERLSTVEDVDITELMTRLANQQLVYETVLRSSSMVMRMSLANYM